MQLNLFGVAVETTDGKSIQRTQYQRAELHQAADGDTWIALEQETAEYQLLRVRACSLSSGQDQWFTAEAWMAMENLIPHNLNLYAGRIPHALAVRLRDAAFVEGVRSRAGESIAGDLQRILDLQASGNTMLWGQTEGLLVATATAKREGYDAELRRTDTGATAQLLVRGHGGANLHALVREVLDLVDPPSLLGWDNCRRHGQPCRGCQRLDESVFLDRVFAAVAAIQALGGWAAAETTRHLRLNPRRRKGEPDDSEE